MLKLNVHLEDHLRKNGLAFYSILFVGVLNSLVTFLLPVSVGAFFTLLNHSGGAKGELLHSLGVHLADLSEFSVFFMLLLLAKGILTFAGDYGTFRQGELFARDIREKTFKAQMGWGLSSMSLPSTGKYLLRYSNDMKSIQLYLTKGVMEGCRSTLFLGIGFLMLLRIHQGLTWIIFGLLAVVIILIYFFAQRQAAVIRSSRSARSSLLAYVSRQFMRFKKLKERQSERHAVEGFYVKSATLYEANMKYNKTESIIQALVPLLIFTIVGVVLWGIILLQGAITPSEGVIFVLTLMMMEPGMRQILRVPTYLNKGKISLDKMDKLLVAPDSLSLVHQEMMRQAS